MSDLRYALRTLASNRGFAVIAVVSLALGIGANAAIYSVTRAVLLDPLPVPAPEELVALGWSSRGVRTRGILQINSTAYRDDASGASYNSNFSYAMSRAFQRVAGTELFLFSYAASEISASIAGGSVAASGLLVSGNYFTALGIKTTLGRPLNDGDDDSRAAPVAVLTDSFWRRTFGSDPGVLGRTIVLNGTAFTLVGVTEPGFYGMSRGGPFFKPTDLLLPLSAQPLVYTRSSPRSLFAADDRWWVQAMARVKPGASVASLEAALNATFRSALSVSSIAALRDASASELRVLPAPRGLDSWTRSLRQPLLILRIIAAIVLLVACVNVGSLMFVRGVARARELSVRLALGSSVWRLARGVVAESTVLTAAGGVLGIAVAVWGARVLLATMVVGSARTAIEIRVDGRLLVPIVAASVVALLLSALPALRTIRRDIGPILKGTSGGASAASLAAGRMLMVAQVAVCVPLLLGAALFLRTVYNLAQVDLGFDPERLLIFRVDPSLNSYDQDRIEQFYGDLLQRLTAVPGVESASVADIVPLSGVQNNWPFAVPGSDPINVKFARVGSRYFETLGIPTIAGRTIGPRDHSRAPRIALMNESAARALFGPEWPIGRRIAMPQANQPEDFEVVGVVRDSRYTSPRDPMPPTVFLPFAQTTVGRLGPMNVFVRASMPAAALAPLVRTAVADVDPFIPLTDLRTQVDQIDETLGTELTFMRLLLAFGAFVLLLASIGLHGVTAYSVVCRTREIGVRVACGARRRDVLWLILRQVIAVAGVGLAIGLPVSVASTRLIRTSLYGVGPLDPASVVATVATLIIVATVAGILPARRAARLDPGRALRHD
jgi:macrolide transport system ATP-binding/permease protein